MEEDGAVQQDQEPPPNENHLRPLFLAVNRGMANNDQIDRRRLRIVWVWMAAQGFGQFPTDYEIEYMTYLYQLGVMKMCEGFLKFRHLMSDLMYVPNCSDFERLYETWDQFFSNTETTEGMWFKISILVLVTRRILKEVNLPQEGEETIHRWLDAVLHYVRKSRLGDWIYEAGWDGIASLREKNGQLIRPGRFSLPNHKLAISFDPLMRKLGLSVPDLRFAPLSPYTFYKNNGTVYEAVLIPGTVPLITAAGKRLLTNIFRSSIDNDVMPTIEEINEALFSIRLIHRITIITFLRKTLRERRYLSA